MKEFRLIEHNLIPLALIFVNVGLVHFIYILAWRSDPRIATAIAASLCLLISGTFLKRKYLLIPGMSLYALTLVITLAL